MRVKQKLIPKSRDPPTAKRDESGNIITSPNLLKKLYLDTYVHRLRHRKIKPELETLKILKEELWERRYQIIKQKKTPNWEINQVQKTLNSLKNNKARDPSGLINELFKDGVAGPDLVKAVTIMINRIKEEQKIVPLTQLANIATIYKNKGSRLDLVNDRGIFGLGIFRYILEKQIYCDKYQFIDKGMSDSNVGGRKGRNIRNHLFMVYGVINSVVHGGADPIDIAIYDIEQCFDAMWLTQAMNDLYDVVEEEQRDDKLALVYLVNRKNKVAVKNPFGLTDRVEINDVILQGSCWGPMEGSVQIDMIGKECVNKDINMYMYKDLVKIMPLSMVDDILTISRCGFPSVASNSFINTKIEMMKLKLGRQKCHQIHVGKVCPFCPTLQVHGEAIDLVEEDKYLGDVISNTIQVNGSNQKNVIKRRGSGMGIITQIILILKTVSLGHFYFEMAVLLRESLLINGIMFNTEVWYALTVAQVKELEEVDKLLLRRVLECPSSTSVESMYLELGLIPLRWVLKGRRVTFLYYLVTLDTAQMLSKIFHAQWNFPVKHDWTETVKNDLKDLDMVMDLEQIKKIKKENFAEMVKKACRKAAFIELMSMKEKHSKLSNLSYTELKMQSYLKNKKIHPGKAKSLFKYRTRMAFVKNNYKSSHGDLNCPVCSQTDENIKFLDDQHHLNHCVKLVNEAPVTSDGQCCQYQEIFGENFEVMSKVVERLDLYFEKRTELLA